MALTKNLLDLDLPVGIHTITADANAQGMTSSEKSIPVTYIVYSITVSGQNITVSGKSKISQGSLVVLEVTPNSGYQLPETITVTGCEYYWMTRSTPAELTASAELTLSSPTANIVATINGEPLPTQLDAPIISISADELTITPVIDATSYGLYSGDDWASFYTTSELTVSNLVSLGTNWIAGDNSICAVATATGYVSSDRSQPVTITLHSIDWETNSQFSLVDFGTGGNYVAEGASRTAQVSSEEGYILPQSVTVSGASNYEWSLETDTTATLIIYCSSGDTEPIMVTIVSEEQPPVEYSITYNLTEISIVNPEYTISSNESIILYVNPPMPFYTMQGEPTVTNAEAVWTPEEDTLEISNPTGDVTVEITCVFDLSGTTWQFNDEIDLMVSEEPLAEYYIQFSDLDGYTYQIITIILDQGVYYNGTRPAYLLDMGWQNWTFKTIQIVAGGNQDELLVAWIQRNATQIIE